MPTNTKPAVKPKRVERYHRRHEAMTKFDRFLASSDPVAVKARKALQRIKSDFIRHNKLDPKKKKDISKIKAFEEELKSRLVKIVAES